MSMGTILVTGGAGFLGSQLVKRLLKEADHIYVIDNLATGNKAAIPTSTKITFYEESITNEDLLKDVLPKVDYVFHFACKNLVNSVENVNEDFLTNMYGGYLLLQHAHQYAKKLKRFVYASTASVYGDAEILPTPETYYNIKLPYSASKFSTEHYAQVYYHLYQLPVVTLRFSNVYGPGQLITNPYCGVVAKFFEAAEEGEPLAIFGDGKQTRDFTFVEDAIEATYIAALDDRSIGGVYNVGTGVETNVLQLAEHIQEVTNKKGKLQFLPKRRVDVVTRRRMNIGKIESELNWRNNHTLIEGLEKTYKWLKGEY
ncbi:NAD-dependent epimerase/dehydratase family protein [Priestia koreensis]|uniref:NAD-dependent epimerase/dehydratase family protein n=1 Tax=Priestia koreensis TaxID=284581 RepID=UPI0034583CAD